MSAFGRKPSFPIATERYRPADRSGSVSVINSIGTTASPTSERSQGARRATPVQERTPYETVAHRRIATLRSPTGWAPTGGVEFRGAQLHPFALSAGRRPSRRAIALDGGRIDSAASRAAPSANGNFRSVDPVKTGAPTDPTASAQVPRAAGVMCVVSSISIRALPRVAPRARRRRTRAVR